MTTKNGGAKSVTFKYVAGVFAAIILSLLTLGINHMASAIDKVDKKAEHLEQSKVEKERYITDQQRLESSLDKIDSKLDKISEKL